MFISFIIFSFIIIFYQYEIVDNELLPRSNTPMSQKEFYSQDFDSGKKRIFIVGSSEVFSINPIQIKNYLLNYDYEYDIFNLAMISDTPLNRIETLDMMISAKPEIIIYGISDRDFIYSPSDQLDTVLPSPSDYSSLVYNKFKNSLDFDISLFETPQRVTLSYIVDFLHTNENKSDILEYENTPFMKITKALSFVDNDLGFIRTGFEQGPSPNQNLNYLAFKQIINELQNHDIKVIVLVTPHSKFYLDFMPKSQNDYLNLILNDLNSIKNIGIYDLYTEYADLNIWADVSHIAVNSDIVIYTKDVSEIILKEIEP
jgi:hypothetical protein|tara:strand:+ start:6906 stop:7850 length:945 start_codon:yes stop_codon:yes gene_type:complete